MKKEKKEEKLEEICEEILDENKRKWKRRKLDEEAKKILEEEEIEKLVREKIEKEKRLKKAKMRKEEFLARLARKKEIVIIKEGKDQNWIKRKQKQWREYRVKEEIDSEEEEEMVNRVILKIPERKKRISGGEGKTTPDSPYSPLISQFGIESGIMDRGEGGNLSVTPEPLLALKNPGKVPKVTKKFEFKFKKTWPESRKLGITEGGEVQIL